MRSAAVLLGTFAAASSALPQSATAPPTSQEFGLAMTVEGTYVSLNAVYNGTADLALEAERLSVYPGTPAWLDGTSPKAALVLDLTSSTDPNIPPGVYGIQVPDVGDNYGISVPVTASKDYEEFQFSVYNGTIGHTLNAALESWFACIDQVGGEQNYFLRWGVFKSTGGPPDGCETTTVVQNFNVPGGASPPAKA